MIEANLRVADVAQIAGCHRNTVLRYEQRGVIKPLRDSNGFRRYFLRDALKLKEILSLRKDGDDFDIR